jgi:hypothetical protein
MKTKRSKLNWIRLQYEKRKPWIHLYFKITIPVFILFLYYGLLFSANIFYILNLSLSFSFFITLIIFMMHELNVIKRDFGL